MKKLIRKRVTKLTLISFFLVIIVFSIPVSGTSTNTSSITSTTYTRINIDKVDIATGYSFGLADNYTLLKLYFVLFPSSQAIGTSIGSKTVDYNTYNNATSGTTGIVTGTTTMTVYDTNAKNVGVYGADKVYLFLYVYNNSVASSNLLKKSSADVDYFPSAGRYGDGVTDSTTKKTTSTTDYLIYAAAGAVGVVIIGVIFMYSGLGSRFKIGAPKRDTLIYKDGRRKWVERNPDGSFKDIVDIGRSMKQDRRKPHLYGRQNLPDADRRPQKK